MISRIIEVDVGIISRSRRLRLLIPTETSIVLDITKTESNNCFIANEPAERRRSAGEAAENSAARRMLYAEKFSIDR